MSEKSFECQIIDADFPSGTIRFRAPRDFMLAGGMYEIKRIRSSTPEDVAKFKGRKSAPKYALEDCKHCNA